jgi:polar amino acid transport system substrate-binding protein
MGCQQRVEAKAMRFSFSAFSKCLAILAVAVIAFTGETSRAQEVVPEARASLPDAIREAGVLRIVTTYQWPPFTFQTASGELDGVDASIMKLLAAKLGLKAEFTDITSLPVMLNGVSTGRFDVAVGQMGITEERVKIVDFVPYFRSGYALLVQKGNTSLNINNLCGHTLAITQGSSQVPLVDGLSKSCVQAGKQEIKTDVYPQANLSQLAVANGRGEGFVTGSASAVYNAKGNPQLEVAPGLLENHFSMVGIVIAKDNAALHKALTLALDSAVADGSYKAILSRFDVLDSGLSTEQMHTPAAQLAN